MMKHKSSLCGHGTVGKSTDSSMIMPLFPANNVKAITLLSLMIIGWVGILFTESTRPPAEFLGRVPQLDKLAHFGAFFILGLLVCSLSLKLRPKSSIPLFPLPLLVVILCGVLEEYLQMLVPGRMVSIFDLLFDIAGAIFAFLLVNHLGMLGVLKKMDTKVDFESKQLRGVQWREYLSENTRRSAGRKR